MKDVSDKCERCNIGRKHWIANERKKWCARCINIFERANSQTDRTIERLIEQEVGSKYTSATMTDLDEDVYEALSTVPERGDVFMHGPVGCGKTHAMAAILRDYVAKGYQCRRINFDAFCVAVRSTFSTASKQTELDLIEPLIKADVLFIDDLGLSGEESRFAYVTLYSILNRRQENAESTFTSSNKTIEQLGKSFDDRIASRLSSAVIIKITGKDRRRT